MRKVLIIVGIMLALATGAKAAPPNPVGASLNGYVMDSESKETLIGATVHILDAKLGSYTNKLGFYSIGGIPQGERKVKISMIGYEKKIVKIDFDKNESIRKDFTLKPSGVQTKEVFVDAEKEMDKREITISRIDVPVDQLKEIRIGGESDVFRSLQLLPGVLTSSQISSGLYIRGGSPDQNLVLVDGAKVYNPTHLFGFISAFNSEAIKDVELIKGGFPAEYGGRLSAVLNLTQKDGNREEVEGKASLGVISSKAHIEGPLLNGSWSVSGRRTYFELIKSIYPEDDDAPLPDYHFYDLNAKITQNITKNDKVFLSGFAGADKLGYAQYGLSMEMNLSNMLGSIRWTHIFGDNLFSTLNLTASEYTNGMENEVSGYETMIDNSITDYTAKGTMEWFVSDKMTAKFGLQATEYHFMYEQNFTGETSGSKDTSGTTVDIHANQTRLGGFGQFNYKLADLLNLQAGLRVDNWDVSDITVVDPRLALKYHVTEDFAIKGAWGIYSQNLRLASQPDFSFFDTWLPTDSTVPLSRARHYILSFETEPYKDLELKLDVYYKKMSEVSELRRTALQTQVVSDVFYIGDAEAYGAEIFLQKKYGRLTGWVGYALGWIYSYFEDINGGERFRPKYDRRHDLKIVAQYDLTENIDVGATFLFQSGQSYTGATSRFQTRLPGQNYGEGKLIPSQRYGLRLPPSHQLNINGSYGFDMFGLDARVILDIYNVYNRRDIWFRYYDVGKEETSVEDVRLLPILPTLSFEVEF